LRAGAVTTNNMRVFFLACYLPLVLALATHSQADELISTERPSFSASPVALARSVMQIELGYQFTRASGGDATDHTLPLALFRAGVAERLELHLGWAGLSRIDANGGSSSAVNGASLGAKWQLNESDSRVPIALFGGLTLPVDSDDGEIDPLLGVFWSASVVVDWFGNVLLTESDGNRIVSNALGVSMPFGHGTGGYVEYYGRYGDRGGPENYINAGVSHALRDDLAVDASAGAGLNDRSADFYIGLGISRRF